MKITFGRSRTPPSDRAIKDRATRTQRKWLDDTARKAKERRVISPREVEFRIAELDALDEMDYF